MHYALRLMIYHIIIVVHCPLPINIDGILISVAKRIINKPLSLIKF